MMDLTGQYNTQLSPEEEQAYQAWARAGGRDPQRETYDYDLRGYYKTTGGAPLGEGHLTDQFKKPNHPSFSDESQYHGQAGNEGGHWGGSEGAWTFRPGKTNLQIHGHDGLQKYFSTFEPGTALQLQGMEVQ